jgi:hypothetical protein
MSKKNIKKDVIVQFVGFTTRLDFEEFSVRWEQYANRNRNKKMDIILQQQFDTNCRFKYVSQHEWPPEDFQFAFMKGRESLNFPEHNVKVVQTGGYSPVQTECRQHDDHDLVKLMVFISHNETDIDFYKELSCYHFLNIYQAYYESCSYGYVLEFFTEETNMAELLLQLKTRTGIETGIYRECLVPNL